MQTREIIFHKLAEDLVDRYGLSTRFINIMLKEYKLEECEYLIGELNKVDKLLLIINSLGFNFFSGSKDITKEIRYRIIEQWNPDKIDYYFAQQDKAKGKTKAHKVGVLAKRKWHNGKGWAMNFVRESGFNPEFAGFAGNEEKKQDIEDIEPLIIPPPLKDFQIFIKDKILENLRSSGDNAKCMISLPTGGGKTRTAVEAYIEWLRPRFSEGKYLIWIAQSEELCEQAIASIKQLWSSKEFSE